MSKEISEGLLDAIKKNNIARVKTLINKGASLLIKDKNGKTPITLAIEEGNPTIVNLIVSDLNDKTKAVHSDDVEGFGSIDFQNLSL